MPEALEHQSYVRQASSVYYGPKWSVVHEPPWLDHVNEEVDYLSVVRRLWRRKLLILSTCALVTTACAGVVAILPRQYVADALILVDGTGGMSSLLVGSTPSNSPALQPDAEAVQTEVEILQSPALAEQVIRNLKLENHREFNPDSEKSPQPAATRAGADVQLAQTVKNFLARLHVGAKDGSRVIAVAFEAREPKLAARVANALVKQYIADQQELRSTATTQQANWLQNRIDSLQRQAAKDQRAIAEFRAKAGLFSAPGGTPLLVTEMSNVSAELEKERATRATLEDRLGQLHASLSATGPATSDVLDSPVIRALRIQEATLEAQYATNSQDYGPQYPKTVALRAQISSIKDQMRVEAQKIASALQNSVAIARMTERQLTNRLNTLKQEVSKMDGADVTLGALQRQAEADRLVLSNYLARFKELGNPGKKVEQHPTSEVISYAQLPVTPSAPRSALLIGIAAACSLLGSCAFVLFRDKIDRSFKSLEELAATTGIKGLALIPLTAGASQSPIGIAKYGNGSSYREALKAIYTQHVVLSDGNSRTSIVTSALPGEGKTTLVLGLATLAAQAGQRTIVVDADFWRAGATKALCVRVRGSGLADVLEQKATLADALVSETSSGIDLLPPGKFSDFRGASVDNLSNLLEVLAARYDFVIIDSPPVFAVSEALVLAAHADETIVAIRWAKTPRETVSLALKRLREAGANVGGAVLTFVDAREHLSYGYAESAYFSKEVEAYYAPSGAIARHTATKRAARGSTTGQKSSPATTPKTGISIGNFVSSSQQSRQPLGK